MKFFAKSSSRQLSRQGSSTGGTTASLHSSSSVSHQGFDLTEQVARLQAENRRLRQVTKRIATKIGIQSIAVGGNNDYDDDDAPPPPAHIILAQAHRLQRLNQLVVELSQVPQVLQAYKIVAQYTREIVGAARVSIAMLQYTRDENDEGAPNDDKDKNEPYLELYALDGHEGAMPLGIRLSLTNTQVGHVVTTKRPVRVMDTRPDSNTPASHWTDVQNLHSMGVMASVDVPLISSGRVLGTLNTGATDPAVYYPEVEQILLQIASVLASAMEKDQLRNANQQNNTNA